MDVENDAKGLHARCTEIWPDLSLTYMDFKKPTMATLICISEHFLTDLIGVLVEIRSGSNPIEESKPPIIIYANEEYQEVIVLYKTIDGILTKVKIQLLNLFDFYQTNPKRFHNLSNVFFHFSCFVNNCVEKVSDMGRHCFQTSTLMHSLGNEKEVLLGEINDAIVTQSQQDKNLKKQDKVLKDISQEYEQMLLKKQEKHDQQAKLRAKIESLRKRKVDSLEYEEGVVMEKYADLQEKVVTHADFTTTIDTLKSLRNEDAKLNQEIARVESNNDEDSKVLYLQSCLGQVEAIQSFSSESSIHIYEKLAKDLDTAEKVNLDLENKIKKANSTFADNTSAIQELKETKLRTHDSKNKQHLKLVNNKEVLIQEIDLVTTKCKNMHNDLEKIYNKRKTIEEEIRKLENLDKELKQGLEVKYKRILDAQKEVVNTFHVSMLNLKETLHAARDKNLSTGPN